MTPPIHGMRHAFVAVLQPMYCSLLAVARIQAEMETGHQTMIAPPSTIGSPKLPAHRGECTASNEAAVWRHDQAPLRRNCFSHTKCVQARNALNGEGRQRPSYNDQAGQRPLVSQLKRISA